MFLQNYVITRTSGHDESKISRNHVNTRTKSRQIMSLRDLVLVNRHHEKIRSSRERNLAKSCHHEIVDSLYNMLMLNDQSRSVVAAAATEAASVAACGRCRLDEACPGTRITVIFKHLLLLLHVAVWCSATTTLYNILDRRYI